MADEPNYQAVIADLKRQRQEIDNTIAALERIATATGRSVDTDSGTIESDSFFSMSIPDAAKKFLRIKKRPQSAPEIARALEQGGYIHQSSDFTQTVATTLLRVWERDGTILKLPDKKWALGEWYGTPKPRAIKEKEENKIDYSGRASEGDIEGPIDYSGSNVRALPA